MCDKETKLNFKWSHVAEGAIIIILVAMLTQIVKMRDAYQVAESIHAQIPDGFFTKHRYGVRDAMEDRRFNEAEREALEARIQALERISVSHIQESEVWKQTIRDSVTAIHALEKIMWRTSGFEPTD